MLCILRFVYPVSDHCMQIRYSLGRSRTDSALFSQRLSSSGSQDALNSLIGSPAGYVGCNHGELSEKIKKSKVGVLLCDEFEKTTRSVFSFFLELLEEGQFTDSMAREYDMDGFVIIFTSNLLAKQNTKKPFHLNFRRAST